MSFVRLADAVNDKLVFRHVVVESGRMAYAKQGNKDLALHALHYTLMIDSEFSEAEEVRKLIEELNASQ